MFCSRLLLAAALLLPTLHAQTPTTVNGWQMQDVAKVGSTGEAVSRDGFKADGWYRATVPGTVLTTLVDNKVYPDPLYGENMRAIPESLNKTSWWYRSRFSVPAEYKGKHTFLHFEGINYSAEVWVNGQQVGTMRGAFKRGEFDISSLVTPGKTATVAVRITPQPHPGIPHEHTVANGVGLNGGETALDGATFLSTIGWDWLTAVRDRDTGIWLPVTIYASGSAKLQDTFVTSDLAADHTTADLTIATGLKNLGDKPVQGDLVGTIHSPAGDVSFRKPMTLEAGATPVTLDSKTIPELHVQNPQLWWPNGYGPQNLYSLKLQFVEAGKASDQQQISFGIRKIEYQVPDSENLTISVNGVRVMARGGNWGLDEAMKRVSPERLEAQFRMHKLANLNFIRNWVGQSTSPMFYEMADKYGILLWDEFFQPNPSDGPDVADIPTYLANVQDKIVRYRNHPSVTVWCARNEGYPPKALDDQLKAMMVKLDPSRLYQSNSADGRGVSSHGPYYWRAPRFFYALNESFKTETGSMSVPTIESIQGMMPKKDWETINDDWAQHDMAKGAQQGDNYPHVIAHRYGHVRNLADFVRKAQLANYEAFRAMYEGRNAQMFLATTGVLTWMSHPAQPSFVWQLYHYDLEPNASLYAAKKASETLHIQLNEATRGVEVVNNTPAPLTGYKATVTAFNLDGRQSGMQNIAVADVAASTTVKAAQLDTGGSTPVYFLKFDLQDASGKLVSTNFYWQNEFQEDFTSMQTMPTVKLDAEASLRNEGTLAHVDVVLRNNTAHVALMTHLQLHDSVTGTRILPAFASENYISLAPGEMRTVTIDAAAKDLPHAPAVLIDGYNVDVNASTGAVPVQLNRNAQPEAWPATEIVRDPSPL